MINLSNFNLHVSWIKTSITKTQHTHKDNMCLQREIWKGQKLSSLA